MSANHDRRDYAIKRAGVSLPGNTHLTEGLMFTCAGVALTVAWLALLPAWVETFRHARCGVGLQMLIFASAVAIALAAVQCCRSAYKNLRPMGRDLGLFTGRRLNSVTAMACRPLYSWRFSQRRVAAPAVCQRTAIATGWR